MDIRNMRQLLAVRQHGSFAKAAAALGMSQPSLSAAIARLEDELKVKLFDRTASGSQITAFGELIAERASKVILESEQIVRDAALAAGGEAGLIRLGLGTALRQAFMPKLVTEIARNYPGMELHIELLARDRLVPMVRARDLDLIICALGQDVGLSDLVVTEVFTTRGVAVASPSHPLAAEKGVSTARFAELTSAGAALLEFSNDRVLAPHQGPSRLLHYRSSEYEPLIQLALGGFTTLIAPEIVLQPYLSTGALVRIELLDWSFKVTFAAIATRAASSSPMVSRIVRLATAIGAELQAEEG